jgi:hypothetical protein
MEPEGLSPCLQAPAASPYPEAELYTAYSIDDFQYTHVYLFINNVVWNCTKRTQILNIFS